MRNILSAKNCTILSVLLLAISFSCRKEYELADSGQTTKSLAQTINLNAAPMLSQTRTASYLNNLNNFRQVYGDQEYPNATASDVAVDDGIYANTAKLMARNDSTKDGPRSISSLALQGFGFTIPDNATIENIV